MKNNRWNRVQSFEEAHGFSRFEMSPSIQRWEFQFDNGYGASVIRGITTYGGKHGYFELGVLLHGWLCYTTPITDDVLGFLTEEEVLKVLERIRRLG